MKKNISIVIIFIVFIISALWAENYNATSLCDELNNPQSQVDCQFFFSLRKAKNFEESSVLLKKGANINCKWMGCTALHYATRSEAFETIQYLVKNGADVNAACSKDSVLGTNIRPLHIAVLTMRLDIVLYFINNKADVNVFSEDFGVPLHCALKGKSFEITKVLVEHGAKIDRKDPAGKMPCELTKEIELKKLLKCKTGSEK